MLALVRLSILTGRHLRAARALLNWTQQDAAAKAKVAAGTLKRMEAGDGPVFSRTETLLRIQLMFEKAGIEFLNDDHPGVRFHHRPAGQMLKSRP